jgi:nucleoprotein TPR
LQDEYTREKKESARAKQMLESIMSELAERAPVYESFRVDLENMRLENEGISRDLFSAQSQREEALQQVSDFKLRITKLEDENRVISQGICHDLIIVENRDLGRQVQGLLRQMETVGTDFAGIRSMETSSLQRISDRNDEGVSLDVLESESDAIISEKLVVFRNIEELQNQNQTLRRTVRNLSKKMEEFESDQNRQRDEQLANEMEDASKAIQDLQEQLRVQSLKLDTFVRERDQWKKIAEGRLPLNSPVKDKGSRSSSPGTEKSRKSINDEIDIRYKELYVNCCDLS